MQRRQFIRIAGGGVILAATAALPGCAYVPPPEAIASWGGPGDEPDPRRWVLSYAILAPHSHNLQSWLVDLSRPDEILLRCDRKRLLPETDPFSRQIMMSHGTFLELLDIAARERGLRAEITLFPEGEYDAQRIDERPVAHIRLVPDAALRRDPLFADILTRRTNRSLYELARPVPDAAWQAMAAAVAPHPLRLGFVGADRADLLQQHRRIAAEAWRIELVTPRTIIESYRVLRVGVDEIARHRDGLALTDPLPVLLKRIGLLDFSKAPAPDSFAVTSQIKDFGAKLDATPGFLWLVSEGNGRRIQIDAGRAYARVQLAATSYGVAMQPISQALQEYPEQAGPYAEIHRLLAAPQPAHTVQMWARVGYAPAVPPAPRRGLDAHIVRA